MKIYGVVQVDDQGNTEYTTFKTREEAEEYFLDVAASLVGDGVDSFGRSPEEALKIQRCSVDYVGDMYITEVEQ